MNTTAETEFSLLRRFDRERDAEAFAQIIRIHANVVYGACLRITGNSHDAADAAQDTFFHLLRNAGNVTGSLGGWLHQVATRRAIDLVRRDSARRQRDQAYAAQTMIETDRWSDVLPLMDEALNELDPEARDLLVRHFLQGQTVSDIAAARGVSRPTVSRRVEQGVQQLRERLKAKGVLVATATLGALLPQAAQSAPVAVLQELGKIALAASGATAAETAVAVTGFNIKLAIAAAVVVTSVGGYVAYNAMRPTPQPQARVAIQSPAQTAPALVEPVSPPPVALVAPPAAAPASVSSTTPALEDVSAPAPASGASQPQPARRRGGGVMINVDPSTPQGALTVFTLVLASGDLNRLQNFFVAGSPEFNGFQRLMTTPKDDEERAMRQCLLSLGPPVQVVEAIPTDDGLRVKWRARVTKDFSLEENGVKKLWRTDDRFDLEIRLRQVGTEWKVVGF